MARLVQPWDRFHVDSTAITIFTVSIPDQHYHLYTTFIF